MEIALVGKDSIRIKGKHSIVVVDPQEKATYNAALLLRMNSDEVKPSEDGITIQGPGEYEVGGIKMTGLRSGEEMVYSLLVDGIDVLVGRIRTIEKLMQKLKEHHIVVAYEDEVRDASFMTGVATRVVMFYGEKGRDIANAFGKDTVKEMSKYTSTLDKLPTEIETVILV